MRSHPTREEIFSQLSRILRSQTFRNSDMLRNFLSYIVREKLEDNATSIKQYSIAVHAFGRSPQFDATSDPIVRIQASRLRRNLDVYYMDEGKADAVKIGLPKGSYVPEINFTTVEPVEEEVFSKPSSTKDITHSIAIFPLRNLSEDPNKQLVVDGFTEELLAEISLYRHLHVIRANEEINQATRNSISRFSLEGTIRFAEAGAKISLTVSDNYSLEVMLTIQRRFDPSGGGDLIELQEEIAASVAQQIAGISGVVPHKLLSESNWESTQNPTAYDTYLHFYKYTHNTSPENAASLLEKVSKVVESEPGFAPGLAVLSRLYSDGYIYSLDPVFLKRGLEMGKKGVELQINNQACQTYYAYALMLNEKYEDAKKHGKIAVELNPNSIHYAGGVGFLFCMMDEQEKGMALMNRSMSMDFRYPWWFHVGTFVYYLSRGEYEFALIDANKCEASNFWTPLMKLVACQKLGQQDMALKHLQDVRETKVDFFDNPSGYINALLKNKPARKVMVETLSEVISLSQDFHT